MNSSESGNARGSLGDVICIGTVVLLTVLVSWHRAYYDNWVSRHDVLTQILPWYDYLGQRLRQFQIPAWNPHLNSGASFTGDPQSGWMLFQAMFSFTLFPNAAKAIKAMVGLELLIGGVATYGFARALKIGSLGAALSAIIFEFGPLLYHTTTCCAVRGQFSPWIPVALLGIEWGLADKPWSDRLAPIFLAAFGMSQLYASFLGQGSLDGMLLIGAYVAYRAFLTPPNPRRLGKARLTVGVGVGFGSLLLSGLLGAAGLLPRFSFVSKTKIGGGYGGVTDIERQHIKSVTQMLFTLISDRPEERYLSFGGIAVILFLFGALLAWKRPGVPFFVIFTVVSLILAMGNTPLHWVFYLIPRFQDLHEHYPEQETAILMIGPAIVAGAGFEALASLRNRRRWLLWAIGPFLSLAGTFIYLQVKDLPQVGVTSIIAGGLATVIIVAMTVASASSPRVLWAKTAQYGPVLLVVLAFILPTGFQLLVPMIPVSPGSRWESAVAVDAAGSAAAARTVSYTAPDRAGEFLQQQLTSSGPFRYVGYAGYRYGKPYTKWDYDYMIRRLHLDVLGILTNGRSMFLNLYDTQTYNPSQYRRYVMFIQAINGVDQDYHVSFINETGLDSKLFVLLNARYVLLDRTIQASRSDVIALKEGRTTVYRDKSVVVLESIANQPSAAWIVHDVQTQPFDQVLAAMNAAAFDPRTMAIVETPVPDVQPLTQGAQEAAVVTDYQPESIALKATASSNGMLVISDVYDADWHAYVDGKHVAMQPVDMAFRGVPITAGAHTVELRYEPRSLTYGLWLTGLSMGAWLMIVSWRLWVTIPLVFSRFTTWWRETAPAARALLVRRRARLLGESIHRHARQARVGEVGSAPLRGVLSRGDVRLGRHCRGYS